MTHNQNKILDQKLKNLQKNIVGEVGKFLEEHVLEPIFGIKKDLKIIKKDVREVKHSIEQTDRRIDTILERGDRQDDALENQGKRISRLEEVSAVAG
jgi:DNA repair ATPase RecN